MRSIPDTVQRLFDLAEHGVGRSEHVRVLVEVDGTEYDLTELEGRDWVVSVEIDLDVDSQTISGEIVLVREDAELTLSPGVDSSKINALYGDGRPLLALYRRVRVECAIMPEGIEPQAGDWIEMLDGRLVELVWEPEARLTLLDAISEETQRWIEEEREYGDDEVENVIQEILHDWADGLQLHCPESPDWQVRAYMQEPMSVHQAIQNIVAEFGWCIGPRWDDGEEEFRLTLYDPDREKETPDHAFSPENYLDVTAVEQSLADVRNVVKVVYGDEADKDAAGEDKRKPVIKEDGPSIELYGRRFMGITEAACSNIATHDEAERLVDAALFDLSEPKTSKNVLVPLFPFGDVTDLYRLQANAVHFDADQDLAVTTIRHTLRGGTGDTSFGMRGRPAARVIGWLEREGRTGVAQPPRLEGPHIIEPDLRSTPGGIEVDTRLHEVSPRLRRRWEMHEVHVGKEGFEPSSDTMVARGSERRFYISGEKLPPGEQVEVIVIGVDRHGNRSEPSAGQLVMVGRTGSHLLTGTAVATEGLLPGGRFTDFTRG